MSSKRQGLESLSDFYEIKKVLLKKSAKLKTSLYSYRIDFKNVADLDAEEIGPLLYQILEEIFNKLFDQIKTGTFIRLAFESPSLQHPVNMPYMKIDEANLDLIMNKIESVLNSNEQLQLDGCVIHLQETVFPSGSGKRDKPTGGIWKKRKIADIDTFLRTRQRYIIPGPDQQCLPKVIALGCLYHENRTAYTSTVRNKWANNVCSTLSESLLLRSSISDTTQTYSVEEIAKIQKLIPYRIIVIGLDSKGFPEIVFAGPQQGDAVPTVKLFVFNEHYYLINSIESAFLEHLCLRCLQFYAKTAKHKCKEATCKLCSSINCANTIQKPTDKLSCFDCNYSFASQYCYMAHLSVCGKHKICTKCKRSYCSKRHGVRHSMRACQAAMAHFCTFCKTTYAKNEKHECFVQPAEPLPADLREKTSFIYIDSETRVRENQELEPVILVSQTEDATERHYWGADAYVSFIIDLVQRARQNPDRKFRVFAHYAKGFENLFMVSALLRLKMRPKVLMRGNSVLQISLEPELNIVFCDSYLFVQQSLGDAAKTLQVDAAKGRFPFGILQQPNAINLQLKKFPAKSLFWPEMIKSENEMVEFTEWFDMESKKYDDSNPYNVRDELIYYASNDVTTLRLVLQKFDDLFDSLLGVRSLLSCTTLQEAVLFAFRLHDLKANSLQMIPHGKMLNKTQFSNIACKWIEFKSTTCGHVIQHARNGGEAVIFADGQEMSVDGFCSKCNTVYEFYGCYFHACDSARHHWNRPDNTELSPTHSAQKQKDKKRETSLKNAGYNVVTIFECEFYRQMEHNKEVKEFFSNFHFEKEILKPSDAIIGGRCEAFSSYYNIYEVQEQARRIKYSDFNSLYPSLYSCHLPNGDCIVLFGLDAKKIGSLNEIPYECGLLFALVDPPEHSVIPVLPYRSKSKKKLIFGLCGTCMEKEATDTFCIHTREQRRLKVTLTLPEIRYAVNKCGYQLHSVIEAWLWKSSDNLFGEIQKTLYKWKMTSSNYPAECTTATEKEKYLQFHKETYGIDVRADEIKPCSATRQVAKTALTAFWGKFIQRSNMPKTDIVAEFHELSALFFDETKEIEDAILLDENFMLVQSKYNEEMASANCRTAAHVGAHILGNARIKLHTKMAMLNPFHVLYVDTDSIIYHEKADEDILSEQCGLGQLQSEFQKGEFGYEFGATGQKSYYVKIKTEDGSFRPSIVKLKGLVLNQKTKDKLNESQMKRLIRGEISSIESSPVRQLRKSRFAVKQTEITKKLQMTNDKRMNLSVCLKRAGLKPSRAAEFATVPIGFKFSENVLKNFLST